MAIIFAGTSTIDFTKTGGVSRETLGAFLYSNVSEGVAGGGSTPLRAILWDAPAEMWFSYRARSSGNFSTTVKTWFTLTDAAGNSIARLHLVSSSQIDLQLWDGSAWVQVATTSTLPAITSGVVRLDVHFKKATSGGVFAVYADGALSMSYTGDTDRVDNNVAEVRFTQAASNSSHVISAMFAADEDTRTLDFAQRRPGSNGAETAWTGTYLDVDETSFNDSDFISTNTDGAVETMGFGSLPSAFSTNPIVAIIMSGRGQLSSGITQIKGIARVGSVNYENDPRTPYGSSYGSVQHVFDVNPATGGSWTYAEVNAAQFGYKAVA